MNNIYINYPFISFLISFLLIVGVYEFGNYLLKIGNLSEVLSKVSDLNYQKIFVGGNFLLFFFYPLILFLESKIILLATGTMLLALGIKRAIFFLYNKDYSVNFKIKNNLDFFLFLIIFISLFVISSSPVTNADALDYHMTVARNIANYGKYPLDLTHFHARLSGSGEIIIALGLIFGAEQFGSIFQFAGFLSLVGILLKTKNSFFYILLLITSPVVFFLSSSPKPQLFNICSVALVFYIFIINSEKSDNLKDKTKIILGLAILMIATQVKFSFNLSAILIACIIFYFSKKNSQLKIFFISGVLLFFLIVFPPILWKFINFGGNFFQHIFYPVPINFAGMKNFNGYLTNVGSHKSFFNIIFPISIGEISNSLGMGVFLFCYLILRKIKILSTILISLFVLLSLSFGQINARFFYEPFIWIVLVIAFYENYKENLFYKYLLRLQFFIFAIISVYAAFALFSGAISKSLRDNMMSSYASGYSLFRWANKELPKDSAILSYHRSIFLSENKALSVDLLSYSIDINQDFVNNNNGTALLYWAEIQRIKPKYLLTYGYEPYLMKIQNCIGRLYKMEENLGFLESRNPFNKPSKKYNGYIYELNYQDIPNCLYKSSNK